MAHLFIPDIPIAEKIIRSVIVYLFLLLAFRFMGKRQVGQLTPFDLVVLLIISNVVQNAVIGSDNSLGGGLIGATTILILNFIIVELVYRWKGARRFLETTPTLLIHNGRILKKNLAHELLTHDDLLAAIRQHGLTEPSEVHLAVIEDNGSISIVPKSKGSL